MARAYHARAAGVIGLMQQRARLSTARTLVVLMPTILFLHAQARPVRSDDGFSAAASVRNEGFTPEGSFEDQFDQETGLDHDRWSTSGYWANSQPFNAGWDPAYWTNRDNTMILQLKRIPFQHQNWYLPFTSGELRSKHFYGAGCYSVCMKPSAVSGVSTSFYIQNGFWDSPFERNGDSALFHNEVDIEFVGYDTTKVQTNFFSRIFDPTANSGSGNEEFHDLGFDASQNFAAYSFKWQPDRIDWFVNGQWIRGVEGGEGKPAIPDPGFSPVRIAGNLWPVNKQAEEWAGELDSSFQETEAQYAWVHYAEGNDCYIKTSC